MCVVESKWINPESKSGFLNHCLILRDLPFKVVRALRIQPRWGHRAQYKPHTGSPFGKPLLNSVLLPIITTERLKSWSCCVLMCCLFEMILASIPGTHFRWNSWVSVCFTKETLWKVNQLRSVTTATRSWAEEVTTSVHIWGAKGEGSSRSQDLQSHTTQVWILSWDR